MSLALALHLLLVLSFSTRILLRDDFSPPARLAWFIVLNVLPYLGSLAYFLFGEIDLGNKAHKRHDQVFAEIRSKAARFMGSASNTGQLVRQVYRQAFYYAGSINGFHPMPGNQARLMGSAEETIAQMLADMDAASDH